MKKILGLVIILIVLILGSYYGMGLVTERTLKKNVNIVNQTSGIYVDLQHYHRGWFTSDAKMKWNLHIPERVVKNQDGQSTTVPAQDYTVDMPLKVYHGPIIFANKSVQFGLGYAHTNLELPEQYQKQFGDFFTADSTRPHLDVSVLVNYLNRSRLRINLPKFKLVAKENQGVFEWNGLTNDVTISSNLDHIDGDFEVEGMSFKKDASSATVGKVTSDYDLEQTSEGLYIGEASVSIPSFVVTENDQKVFDISDFKARSESDVEGGLFHTSFDASLKQLTSHGKVYGPGVVKVALKNLDAQILGQINAQANKMQQGTDQERQQALMTILPELPKLFSKGAIFEISEMSLAMPEGKVHGTLHVALPQGDIGNPFELLQKVEGEGRLQVPTVVIKALMRESVKQKMQQQGNLPQAIADQMKQNDVQAPDQQQPAEQNTAVSNPPQPAPQPTAAETEQQATAQAEQKLAGLVQSGLLLQTGNDYVIELKLANGQLTVNGQPFSPSMVQF